MDHDTSAKQWNAKLVFYFQDGMQHFWNLASELHMIELDMQIQSQETYLIFEKVLHILISA